MASMGFKLTMGDIGVHLPWHGYGEEQLATCLRDEVKDKSMVSLRHGKCKSRQTNYIAHYLNSATRSLMSSSS